MGRCCRRSPAGDTKKTPNFGDHGYYDNWLVRLDGEGNILWEQCFGGNYQEEYPRLAQANDGGYVFSSISSSSISGNKTVASFGSTDAWILKLRPDIVSLRPQFTPGWNSLQSGFRFQLSGPTNTYVVDYSTNLQQWIPFGTNVLLNNAMDITDTHSVGKRSRYYRARVQALDPE